MTKIVYATRAQILAAQTLIELHERAGTPIEPWWRVVAAAKPKPRRTRAPRAAQPKAS